MPYAITPLVNPGAVAALFTVATTAFLAGPPRIQGIALGTNAIRGDAVVVAGSTSNNATYIVLDVIDANTVEVFPAPTVEAAVGTVAVHNPAHALVITDEVAPTSAAIETAVGDVRMFGRRHQAPASSAGREYDFYGFLFRQFTIVHTGATTTTLALTREVWFLDWERNLTARAITSSAEWAFYQNLTDPGNFKMRLGVLADAGDRRSVSQGCVFIGYRNSSTAGSVSDVSTEIVGSYLSAAADSGLINMGDSYDTGFVSGCLFDAGVVIPPSNAGNNTLSEFRNCIISSQGPGFVVTGTLTASANVLVADTATAAILFFLTVEAVFEEFEFSDAVLSPPIIFGASAGLILNPREDYTAAELGNLIVSGALVKAYTFNPRFVDINSVAPLTPAVGAVVMIERLTDAHYLAVTNQTDGTYTVTINGEAHTHGSTGQTNAQLRDSLVTAINGGSQPVTAVSSSNGGTVAGTTGIFINSDVSDTSFTIAVTAEPTVGDVVVDPAPGSGPAVISSGDYREGEITGSPFTLTAAGRLNASGGVNLERFVQYELGTGTGVVNCRYRVTVDSPHSRQRVIIRVPAFKFDVDLPLQAPQMGDLRL